MWPSRSGLLVSIHPTIVIPVLVGVVALLLPLWGVVRSWL
jgi:hypothetical protein